MANASAKSSVGNRIVHESIQEPYDWDSSSASDIDDPKMPGSDIDKAMLKRLYAGTACEEAILFMQMRQQAVLETEDKKDGRKQVDDRKRKTIICDRMKKRKKQKCIYIYE